MSKRKLEQPRQSPRRDVVDLRNDSDDDVQQIPPPSGPGSKGDAVLQDKPPQSPQDANLPPDSKKQKGERSDNRVCVRRLTKEFTLMAANNGKPSQPFSVSLVDDDVQHWEVMLPFDESTTLGKDLAKYTPNRSVILRIRFQDTHPFDAPYVRVLTPRFQNGSSNVMSGGAICMDTFSQAGWSPAMSVEKVVLAVQSLLQSPKLEARIDAKRYNEPYTEKEWKASYAHIKRAHWDWDL